MTCRDAVTASHTNSSGQSIATEPSAASRKLVRISFDYFNQTHGFGYPGRLLAGDSVEVGVGMGNMIRDILQERSLARGCLSPGAWIDAYASSLMASATPVVSSLKIPWKQLCKLKKMM